MWILTDSSCAQHMARAESGFAITEVRGNDEEKFRIVSDFILDTTIDNVISHGGSSISNFYNADEFSNMMAESGEEDTRQIIAACIFKNELECCLNDYYDTYESAEKALQAFIERKNSVESLRVFTAYMMS